MMRLDLALRIAERWQAEEAAGTDDVTTRALTDACDLVRRGELEDARDVLAKLPEPSKNGSKGFKPRS